MLIAVLAIAASQGPALATSFDGSMQAYAAEISEGEAVRYSVEASLQGEPILIRSPNLTLDSPRVRALVAEAVQGEWVESRPNQLRLEIGRETVAKLEDQDYQERKRAFTEWLGKVERDHRSTDKEQVANLLSELSSYERRVKDGSLLQNSVLTYDAPTPERELLRALLLQLGPATLAKTPPGDTRTWSDKPVGAQEPFPSGARSAIATYQRASETLSNALGKEDLPKGYSYPWEAFIGNLRRGRGDCSYLLTALSTFRAPIYRLRVYDRQGVLLDAVAEVGPRTEAVPRSATGEPSLSADRIALTDSSTEFMRLFLGGQRTMTQLVRRDPPDAKLLISLEFEPLSVGFGELFTDVSMRLGKTIVAYLPDSSTEDALANCNEDVLVGNSLWRKLATSGYVQIDPSDDAFVLRPENPVQTRRERVGRAALRHYAQQVLDRQGSSPRIECVFCFEGGPGSALSPVSTAWGKCLLPLVSWRFGHVRYWLGTLLGSLGEPQWAELVAGRAVRIKNLAPSQQRAFRRWLEFGGPGPYNYEPTVTASNAIYDYELVLELADDPLVECTAPGQGVWGSHPPVPARLSELESTLAVNKVKPDDLATVFDGRHELVGSTSYTAVGRLGRVDWVRDDVGDLASGDTLKDVAFKDWPETLRTRVLRALQGGG